LSVVVPALDEAKGIGAVLGALAPLRRRGHQVLVVDGGSRDGTAEAARRHIERVVSATRGRASQMNAGARLAEGDVLVFLHADTLLPPDADRLIADALSRPGRHWGRFNVRLSGRHWLLRVIERLMNLRSCVTGIATGDQALFVERASFERVGGFPDIPLMEDVAISRRLRREGRPACVSTPVVTSSRRWEEQGVVRTMVLMWWLRLLYWLGVSPERLRGMYYDP
jgi:rSAM/selenodomain-associated transferase 2